MTMTIGRKLGLGFGVALLFPVVIGAIAYRSTANLLESRKPITHTYQVLGELDDLLLAIVDCETGQRGYILTGDERYLEPYNEGLGSIDKALTSSEGLTVDN
ncbi:CHASE3 domain-containing protein, partial [bacterium]|nr:CHASE3 domain-containing protein [bacterium]